MMRQLYKMITKRKGWKLDAVLAHNSGVHLYHERANAGRYVEARPGGEVVLGFFTFGVPVIADAIFMPAQVIDANTNLEVVEALVLAHLNILGCPFCGQAPAFKQDPMRTVFFRCGECNIDSPEYLIYADLLEWWNRRAS